jgi:hypothetical protein
MYIAVRHIPHALPLAVTVGAPFRVMMWRVCCAEAP